MQMDTLRFFFTKGNLLVFQVKGGSVDRWLGLSPHRDSPRSAPRGFHSRSGPVRGRCPAGEEHGPAAHWMSARKPRPEWPRQCVHFFPFSSFTRPFILQVIQHHQHPQFTPSFNHLFKSQPRHCNDDDGGDVGNGDAGSAQRAID